MRSSSRQMPKTTGWKGPGCIRGCGNRNAISIDVMGVVDANGRDIDRNITDDMRVTRTRGRRRQGTRKRRSRESGSDKKRDVRWRPRPDAGRVEESCHHPLGSMTRWRRGVDGDANLSSLHAKKIPEWSRTYKDL